MRPSLSYKSMVITLKPNQVNMATRIQNTNTTYNKDTTARKEMLLTTFAEKLYTETHLAFREMIDTDSSHIIVAKFCLPNQGATAGEAYWSGEDDATKNGIPIVMLLQGERDREKGTLHPERLPGGKTAIDVVNERLDEANALSSLSLIFDKRSKELHVYLYDHQKRSAFDEFVEQKKQERPPRQPREPRESQTEKAKPNMSEWITSKLKKHEIPESQPKTEQDGFQMVQRRRK